MPVTDSPAVAKPFLKWAGGKTQLLAQFARHYPAGLREGRIRRYVEPFVGSGAVFLEIAQRYDVAEFYLSDVNAELILAYRVVQRAPDALIEQLAGHHDRYYEIREAYNQQRCEIDYAQFSDAWIRRAAYMIFLNKTCFNGLYRVNSRGKFNVPFGRYKKPTILDAPNLLRISELLRDAELRVAPFTACERVVDDHTFVYFDPPYRPISATSSFTSYAKDKFDDGDQRALAAFFRELDEKHAARLMLSNSDPTNENPDDDFFEKLYAGFHIHRVYANRMINAKAERRGKISELLITNYP
jgi:DNA adenine methylase